MKGENKPEAESAGKEMVPFGHVFLGEDIYNTLDTIICHGRNIYDEIKRKYIYMCVREIKLFRPREPTL
jgi:hypothetical protein